MEASMLTGIFFSSTAEAHWFVIAGLLRRAGLLALCFFLKEKKVIKCWFTKKCELCNKNTTWYNFQQIYLDNIPPLIHLRWQNAELLCLS